MKTALIYLVITIITVFTIYTIKHKEPLKINVSKMYQSGSFENLEKIIDALPDGPTKNNLLVVLGAHYLDSGAGLEKILQQYAILEVEKLHGAKTRYQNK